MKVAVEGCCHNNLPQIYDRIAQHEERTSTKVDLLLVCGDFQALRNEHDLAHMSSPERHKHLGVFHEFYSGKRVAPLLTIIIGGNHEASAYMWELYHGGWVAPNVYYLGGSGSVLVNGLRISGVSGIYNSRHYNRGHFENPPYNKKTVRSAFAVREYDVVKCMQLRPVEPSVMLSHDWPSGIAHHGDIPDLIKRKPLFRGDIKTNELGTPSYMTLLKHLRPNYFFCAHHHVRFAARVDHTSASADAKPSGAASTKFLALSLPFSGPGALDFLEFLDIPTPESVAKAGPRLTFDPEWLAITRVFHPYLTTSDVDVKLSDLPASDILQAQIAAELEKIKKDGILVPSLLEGRITEEPPLAPVRGPVEIIRVQQFSRTAPTQGQPGGNPRVWYTNPQTEAFCAMLGLDNKVNPRCK